MQNGTEYFCVNKIRFVILMDEQSFHTIFFNGELKRKSMNMQKITNKNEDGYCGTFWKMLRLIVYWQQQGRLAGAVWAC